MKPKKPLALSVTFVGGKWYNEHGREVPKPQSVTAQAVVAAVQTARVGRAEGCRCAYPANTGHVPGCPYHETALYACERGTRETVLRLAAIAGSSVADLERRRIDFSALDSENGPTARCPDVIPVNLNGSTEDPRRRCWICPYWDRHEATPFDHQRMEEP